MNDQEKLNRLNQLLEYCKASAFYRDRIQEQPLGSLEELKKTKGGFAEPITLWAALCPPW